MHPNLSFLQFFSACFMYSSPSLSSLFNCFDITSLDLVEEAALTIHSSKRCHRMFLFRAWLYHRVHPSIFVFSLQRAG
jgi:hypothetical protein